MHDVFNSPLVHNLISLDNLIRSYILHPSKIQVQVQVQNVLYCIYYKETQNNQKQVHTGVKQWTSQWMISNDIVHKEIFFMV